MLMIPIGVVETFWLALITVEMGIWYAPETEGDPSGYLVAVVARSPFIVAIAVLGVFLAVKLVRRGAKYVEATAVVVLGQFVLLAGIATINGSGESGPLALLAAFWTCCGLAGCLRARFSVPVLVVGLTLGALNALGRLLDDDSTDMMIWPSVVVLLWWIADLTTRGIRDPDELTSSR